MLVLTILVALILFGVVGPWLMGRIDAFIAKGGFSQEEELHSGQDVVLHSEGTPHIQAPSAAGEVGPHSR